MAKQSFKFFTPRDKPKKEVLDITKKVKINQKNVRQNKQDTKARVDNNP